MIRLSKQNKIVALIVLIIILAIIGGAIYILLGINRNGADQVNDGPQVSAKQEAIDEISRREASPPAESTAAQEKADYYLGLSSAKSNAEDYKGAVESYEAAEKFNSSINYVEYMNAAELYVKLNDIPKAKDALNKAETAARQQIVDESDKQESLWDIANLRKELIK